MALQVYHVTPGQLAQIRPLEVGEPVRGVSKDLPTSKHTTTSHYLSWIHEELTHLEWTYPARTDRGWAEQVVVAA
ncbi:MAG: hypothetical protein ACRDQU_10015, partial [Pseudonocardiaceae bacterium]